MRISVVSDPVDPGSNSGLILRTFITNLGHFPCSRKYGKLLIQRLGVGENSKLHIDSKYLPCLFYRTPGKRVEGFLLLAEYQCFATENNI